MTCNYTGCVATYTCETGGRVTHFKNLIFPVFFLAINEYFLNYFRYKHEGSWKFISFLA